MSPTNYWKVGLFVVSGLGVALAALVVLGGRQLDQRVQEFDLYFNEAVEGLSVGSGVRLRGIPIGSVAGITLAPDRVLVHVTIKVYEKIVESLGGRPVGEPRDEAAQRAREMGLRGQLVRNPLTGLAVINVDVFPDAVDQKFGFDPGKDYLYTVPSTFKGLLADAAKMLEQMPGLIEDAKGLLDRVDKAVADLQVGKLSAEAQELLKTVNREIEGLDLAALQAHTSQTLEEARAALRDVRGSVDRLLAPDGSVEKLLATYDALGRDLDVEIKDARVGELSAAARRTLDAATGTAEGATELAAELRADLPRLRRLIDKIRQLADLLDRDPAALLRGKKTSRVLEGGKE